MSRSFGRIGFVLAAAVTFCGLLSAPAAATTVTQFMDSALFKPHHSPITGAMVVNNSQWYGIDVLPQLVILTAETSLGDPKLGGTLARENNFGCLRYGSTTTKWGSLADGKVMVAGLSWFTFPTADVGMMALGRFLKLGKNGAMKEALGSQPYDWEAFAQAYNGGSPDLEGYIATLQHLEAVLRAKAAACGVSF